MSADQLLKNFDTLLKNSVNNARKSLAFLSSKEALSFIKEVVFLLGSSFRSGYKVLIAGNGGSLCDAAHFAEELTGCFRKRRQAFPAIVLSEPGYITCVANDFGFDEIFARGIEAFGKEGDLFFALTTSGNSKNILLAVDEAKKKGMKIVSFLGKGGGALLGKADYELVVPKAISSDRIQEVHMTVLHIIIEAMEVFLGVDS